MLMTPLFVVPMLVVPALLLTVIPPVPSVSCLAVVPLVLPVIVVVPVLLKVRDWANWSASRRMVMLLFWPVRLKIASGN